VAAGEIEKSDNFFSSIELSAIMAVAVKSEALKPDPLPSRVQTNGAAAQPLVSFPRKRNPAFRAFSLRLKKRETNDDRDSTQARFALIVATPSRKVAV
jgi:hypothetical protein